MRGPRSEAESAYIRSEFAGLRDEILKRTELAQQLQVLAVIAFGSLTAVGLLAPGGGRLMLLVPLVATALVPAYLNNHHGVIMVVHYVRDAIEPKFRDDGWEVYLDLTDDPDRRLFSTYFIRSFVVVFVGAPLVALAIGVGAVGDDWTWVEIVLTLLDVVALAATSRAFATAMRVRREGMVKPPTRSAPE